MFRAPMTICSLDAMMINQLHYGQLLLDHNFIPRGYNH